MKNKYIIRRYKSNLLHYCEFKLKKNHAVKLYFGNNIFFHSKYYNYILNGIEISYE